MCEERAINWSLNAISGVGKAINPASEVSFTVGNGINSNVFYPREDLDFIKDIKFIITDGEIFFSDEKEHAAHNVCHSKVPSDSGKSVGIS